MGAVAGVDVLEKRQFSCSFQDLNPDLPAYILVTVLTRLPHTVEGNTKVHINNMRWEFGIGCI